MSILIFSGLKCPTIKYNTSADFKQSHAQNETLYNLNGIEHILCQGLPFIIKLSSNPSNLPMLKKMIKNSCIPPSGDIDHVVTMQCSAGKPYALSFMLTPFDTHHTSKHHRGPNTPPHGTLKMAMYLLHLSRWCNISGKLGVTADCPYLAHLSASTLI